MPRRGPFLLLDLLDVSLFRGFTLLSFGCGVPARFLGLESLRGFRSLDRPRKFLAPLQVVKKTSFCAWERPSSTGMFWSSIALGNLVPRIHR